MPSSALLPPPAPTPSVVDSKPDTLTAAPPPPAGRSFLAGLQGSLTRPLGAFLLLFLAVFSVYAPALNGQFLWDDLYLVKNALLIRSPRFCLEVFRHTLSNDQTRFYRPTQTLTFIADYWFGGLDPFAYHLTSLCLHAGNAVLLCLVLRLVLPRLLPRDWQKSHVDLLALGVALVWAVHPVHNAAVAYISGTADPLAMGFCLTALLLCERALRPGAAALPRALFAVGTGAALLLGLCAKEIAFVWLGLGLASLCIVRPDTRPRTRWTVAAGAVLIVLLYLGLRHFPPPVRAPVVTAHLPPKPVLMLRALGDYGSLLLFPKDLFMERQVFAVPGLANAQDAWFYHLLLLDGLLVLAALGLGAWWPGRGRALRRVGAAWFLVGYLPISNLFFLNASVAEHWLYLPSIGFLLFLAGVGIDVAPLLRGRRPAWLWLGFGLAVVALGLRTRARAFDWSDEVTFFRQTIADGGDAPRARVNLAASYLRQAINGQHPETAAQAVDLLRRLAAANPRDTSLRINLATALDRRGESAAARRLLESILPDLATPNPNGDARELVTTLWHLDGLTRDDAAWPVRRQALLDRGLHQYPNSWELVQYALKNDASPNGSAAPLLVDRFLAAHWWHAPAWIARGELAAKSGQAGAALAAWERASQLDVHDAEAFREAAAFCLQEGRLDQALGFQSRAVGRQPGSPRQHLLLAQVLARQGQSTAAAREEAAAKALIEEADGGR